VSSFLRTLAIKAGISWLEDQVTPKTSDDIRRITCISINNWASQKLRADLESLPFPFIDTYNQEVGKDWEVIDWARPGVQLQHEFYVRQKSTGEESRWINGRTSPMQRQRVNPYARFSVTEP